MKRAYYSDSIANFLAKKSQSVLGEILAHSDFAVEQTQRDSWIHQIQQLRLLLAELNGSIYFEYSIQVDVVVTSDPIVWPEDVIAGGSMRRRFERSPNVSHWGNTLQSVDIGSLGGNSA